MVGTRRSLTRASHSGRKKLRDVYSLSIVKREGFNVDEYRRQRRGSWRNPTSSLWVLHLACSIALSHLCSRRVRPLDKLRYPCPFSIFSRLGSSFNFALYPFVLSWSRGSRRERGRSFWDLGTFYARSDSCLFHEEDQRPPSITLICQWPLRLSHFPLSGRNFWMRSREVSRVSVSFRRAYYPRPPWSKNGEINDVTTWLSLSWHQEGWRRTRSVGAREPTNVGFQAFRSMPRYIGLLWLRLISWDP